eukprot:TRINITY_DN11352_c0_g1_i1.p1 TRINITY_DN11352_c0_g1~~TRINITY_DN11352_c0_g1_i1.p1  ORF type:complete len:296 (-),score=71.53 TRINITY_DN11352_c0_g1_i1:154-1041(-)
MPPKDRTFAFKSLVQKVEPEVIRVVSGKRKAPSAPSKSPLIHRLGAEIGREIEDTTEKLKELTKLAKTKSPFGDPTEKIDEFTYLIKQDITAVQHKIKQLEALITNSKVSFNVQEKQHAESIQEILNSKLLTITKKFGEALEERTTNLKSQQARKEKITGSRRLASTPSPVFQPAFDMFDGDGNFSQENGDLAIPMLLQSNNNDFILERADQVEDVRKQIKEVYEIFTQLAGLVHHQGEQIRRIEDNMDATVDYAESAHKNLLKTLESLSGNRKLILKVFAMLTFFVVLFMLFFA